MLEEHNRIEKLRARESIYSDRTACKSTNNLQLGNEKDVEADPSLMDDVPYEEGDYSSSQRAVNPKEGELNNNRGIPESINRLLVRHIERTKRKIVESQDLIMKKEISNLELKIKINQMQDLPGNQNKINSLCKCSIF